MTLAGGCRAEGEEEEVPLTSPQTDSMGYTLAVEPGQDRAFKVCSIDTDRSSGSAPEVWEVEGNAEAKVTGIPKPKPNITP